MLLTLLKHNKGPHFFGCPEGLAEILLGINFSSVFAGNAAA
jgi:hypothetical protein